MMLGRNLWLVATLVAAVVVPYYLSGDAQWSSMNRWWRSMFTSDTATVDGYNAYYQQPWPGQTSRPPTASTSPLPPNYARRPIQTVLAPAERFPALPRSSALPLTLLPAASAGEAADAGVRPRFHDWVPVQENRASAKTSATKFPLSREVPIGPSLCGPNAPCISHLLNFDVTPAWVMNNWQRVSTRLAEFDLEGLRVPVMTGTEVDDLVGTMTYYFDRRQTLQRISFDGDTGEPSPLVNVMSRQFEMQAEPWLGAGFYVARDETNQLVSVMRITHAPVIRSSEARRRYSVVFELNRPGTERGLSQRFESFIVSDRNSKALEGPDGFQSEEEIPGKRAGGVQPRTETGNVNGATIQPQAANSRKARSPTARPAQPSTNRRPVRVPPAHADPFLAQSQDAFGNQSSERPPATARPNSGSNRTHEPRVQPKPLNGSTEPANDGEGRGVLFGGLNGASESGSRLYPSQLPSQWRGYVRRP